MDQVEILSRQVRQLEAERDLLKRRIKVMQGGTTRALMKTAAVLKAETARADAAERNERNMRLELDSIRNRMRENRKEMA